MPEGYEEADIRAGLREGGSILQAFIVMRPPKPGDGAFDAEYVCYVRTNWRRGYRILQVFRRKGDKVYMGSGVGRLIWLLRREFRYDGPLVIYNAGCEEVQRFAGLQPLDSGRVLPDSGGPPPEAPNRLPWDWPVGGPPPPAEDPGPEGE